MISLLFFMLKQFDLSISQLKDVIKLVEVIEKSMIDNECQIFIIRNFFRIQIFKNIVLNF